MLYIFNSSEQLLTILSNRSEESPAFWNDVHHEKLSGENTFSFTVPADNDDAQHVTEGNLVAWQDLDGYWQMFEIVHKVDTHGDGLIRNVECEHVSYEMLDDFLPEYTSGTTTEVVGEETIITPITRTATYALTSLLAATRWELGIVDVPGVHSYAYTFDNAYSLLQKIAGLWQAELQYRLTITNGVITHRYVDMLVQRGTDGGKQFVYGKDIQNIERDIDISGVCTALYGKGKDGLSVLVTDTAALALWGRANGTRHRYGLYENTEQDDAGILTQETSDDLQKRNTPRATYTLKVVVLESIPGYEDEKTRIGDTVRGIDRAFNPPLLVSTRVVEITRSLSNPENTEVILGTYKPSIVLDLVQQRQQNAQDVLTIQEEIASLETSATGGDLTAEIIKLGIANASGTCQIDTRGTKARLQSHTPGNYVAAPDEGGFEVFVTDIRVASITPEGKFFTGTTEIGLKGDQGDPGPPGTSAISTAIVYAVDGSGVTITKDGVAEAWTWAKDGGGRITAMTSDLSRSITVTY